MAEIKQLPRSGSDAPRAERARSIIFESAIALFGQKGVRATSMNEIAQACGVSKPAIYYYFASKSALLEMLYEEATRDFFARMDELSKAPIRPTLRLRQFVAAHSLYNIDNARFLKIFWRERHELDEATRKSLARRERAYEASVRRIIEDGQADGSFPPRDAQVQTLAILGLLSTVQRWAPYAGSASEAVAEAVASLVMGGICAEGEHAVADHVAHAGVRVATVRRQSKRVGGSR